MPDWFTDNFKNEFARQSEIIGRFNLAVIGKTGVGKSTLINAVFGEEVAATGVGQPVTQEGHFYLNKQGSLGLIDTRGLEVGRDTKALVKEFKELVKVSRKHSLADQVHAVWYCVRGMDRRFEESEAEFIRAVDDMGIGVIMVFTQVPMRNGQVHPDALSLAEYVQSLNLPLFGGRPFFTFALRDQFSDQPAYGLMELLNATFRIAPQAVHSALNAAQAIDMAAKAAEAKREITAAAGAAATAAMTPIPFADATILVPLQLGMMARLAQLYQIRFERAALLAIASTTVATTVGRTVATELLKLIPGAGTLAGGAVSAGVASAFTYAMGRSWLTVCEKAANGTLPEVGGVLDSDAVRSAFEAEFKRRMPRVRKEGNTVVVDGQVVDD